VAGALAGCAAVVLGHHGSTAASPRMAHPAVVTSSKLPTARASYLGVFEPGATTSYRPVTRFGAAVGRQPNIVLYYSGWDAPFQSRLADAARSHGAIVLVHMEPFNVSVASIAAGDSDRYLRSYADAVRAFGKRVIISFAPEMNGSWYSWGWTHTSPRLWIAAWRHIVTVFRAQRASNVTWLWTVNRESGSTGPVRYWWPGSRYVTWVGIDGYYFRQTDTFSTIFRSVIGQVRAFTRDPILLSETAVGPVAGASKILGLVAGVLRDHLLGLVWFDQNQHGRLYHQDWRLEDHPAILAAFRQAVRRYIR
jgi:hypothetical protein